MTARLLAIPVPVVAAVNGHALGGGFALLLACNYRMAADVEKVGMTEAQAGIPFPAGPLEIMRHELAPELLRRLALTSAVLGPRAFLEAGVLDELCPAGDLKSQAVSRAKSLAAQPAFGTVKQQVRGGLAKRLAVLDAVGEDGFLGEFA